MNKIKILVGVVLIVALVFGTASPGYAASHDVAITFGNIGFDSYILQSVTPNYIDLGEIAAEDPDIILQLGKRYQVRVVNFSMHPFQVLAKGVDFSGDLVLLSQGFVVGSLEGDADIQWVDSGGDTVTFTLSAGLYNAMIVPAKNPGYRCGNHFSTMRGNFIICTVPLLGDLNEDCEVNFIDFVLMAANWLECNPEVCL